MNVDELLEYGKIMQLHGLSHAEWNGRSVSIEERLVENGETKCICEVIFSDKKIKVKE